MALRNLQLFETVFDTYTATEIIGEGSSGRVYKSSDDTVHLWAIKLFDSTKVSKERRKRFENEIQFCTSNTYENIVTVTDGGPYIDGNQSAPFSIKPLNYSSLETIMNMGIPPNKVLLYFSQLLDGVEYAHLKNVIHRGIKPETILYDSESDTALIADFGIAHYEEEDLYTAAKTLEGDRLANFQYATPDQKTGGSLVPITKPSGI